MRLSIAIFLLIIVISISFSSGKKKDPPKQNAKQNNAGKNKVNVKKNVKKDESSEERGEAEVDEEYETDEDEDDGDVSEEDESDDDSGSDDEESEDDSGSDDEESEDDDDEESEDDEKEEDNITYLSSEEFQGELREQIQEKGVYYNVETIKQFFQAPDFKRDKEIQDLLVRYNTSEFKIKEKLAAKVGKPMHPFYVVEGVNPAIRRKVAQILAHRLKGLWIVNQPRIMLGPVLKDDAAKKAYYSFSKYMIANKVQNSLFSKPIVTESYWTEHASYIMAKVWDKAFNLPKPGAEVYKFPEDLLVPNVTFAIFNSPAPRIGKKPSKTYLFEQRMLLVYKRFTGAKILIIRHPESAKQIADKIDLYLHGFGDRQHAPKEFNIEVLE